MYGVVCRILLYTSLALGTQNSITVELSTPSAAAPDGVLLCADGRYAFSRDGRAAVSLQSLQEGGSLWALDEEERVLAAPSAPGPGGPAAGAGAAREPAGPWFQTAWPLRAVEVAAAGDLLASDPYYAAARRGGAALQGLARDGPHHGADSVAESAPLVARCLRVEPSPLGLSRLSRHGEPRTDQSGIPLPAGTLARASAAAPGAQSAGNCVLITGAAHACGARVRLRARSGKAALR
jgi:hypothetical protein